MTLVIHETSILPDEQVNYMHNLSFPNLLSALRGHSEVHGYAKNYYMFAGKDAIIRWLLSSFPRGHP